MITFPTLMFFTANLPRSNSHGYDFWSSDVLATIDTVVNGGPSESFGGEGACARSGGALIAPTAIGMATAAPATVASINFFHAFSGAPDSFFMICSILFLRSEPVTPDTHASGDST